jgi:hypothetical protein
MDEVGKYLRKYTTLVPPEGTKKKIFIDVIRSECGITITERHIRLRGQGIYLDCHPVIRGEIQQRASGIISTLLEKHNTRIAFIR